MIRVDTMESKLRVCKVRQDTDERWTLDSNGSIVSYSNVEDVYAIVVARSEIVDL